MRFFASSHRIDQLSPRTRWLIAGLLFGILAQAITGLIIHHRGPGWTIASVSEHYRGRQVDIEQLSPENLQKALDGDSAYLDRPAKQIDALLDIAHMHLAFMPLIVFLVAHLFSMAPFAKAAWAGGLCYATLIAAMVDIATPFLIRYHSASWAVAKISAVVVLEIGLLSMCVTCLMACLLSLFAKEPKPPAP